MPSEPQTRPTEPWYRVEAAGCGYVGLAVGAVPVVLFGTLLKFNIQSPAMLVLASVGAVCGAVLFAKLRVNSLRAGFAEQTAFVETAGRLGLAVDLAPTDSRLAPHSGLRLPGRPRYLLTGVYLGRSVVVAATEESAGEDTLYRAVVAFPEPLAARPTFLVAPRASWLWNRLCGDTLEPGRSHELGEPRRDYRNVTGAVLDAAGCPPTHPFRAAHAVWVRAGSESDFVGSHLLSRPVLEAITAHSRWQVLVRDGSVTLICGNFHTFSAATLPGRLAAAADLYALLAGERPV